mgnify:CR=1 FL=1
MMHLEADVFRKFDKQWALVTAGTPEHYNTMTISWGGLGTLWRRPVATVYVKKNRYTFEEKGSVWEVDEFFGANSGLVVAEIELESEDQEFEKPEWLGEEVSRLSRYLNVELARNPYCDWRTGEKH